jgi:hypothetical protein
MKIKRVDSQPIVLILIVLNISLLFVAFTKTSNTHKFEEIDVERINIIEADGTLKMAIHNSERITKGKGKVKRSGEGTISGMLFYNQEGYEAGGLVFDGKEVNGVRNAGVSLTMDGYRQDQTIALQHYEEKDSLTSLYRDGLRINSRPDRADVREEYRFYRLKYPDKFGDENAPKLSKEKLDSIEMSLARQNKVSTQRIYLGSKRGNLGDGWFDESGLYIKNKYGKDMIRLYVDEKNTPKFEVLDSMGQTVRYNLIPEHSN